MIIGKICVRKNYMQLKTSGISKFITYPPGFYLKIFRMSSSAGILISDRYFIKFSKVVKNLFWPIFDNFRKHHIFKVRF